MPLLEKINASFGEDQQRSFGDYWQYSLIVWIISYDIVVPSSTVLAPSYIKHCSCGFLKHCSCAFLNWNRCMKSLHNSHPLALCCAGTCPISVQQTQSMRPWAVAFFPGWLALLSSRGGKTNTQTHTQTHTQYIHRRL